MASSWSNSIKQKRMSAMSYGYPCKLALKVGLAYVFARKRNPGHVFDAPWVKYQLGLDIQRQRHWLRPRITSIPADAVIDELIALYDLVSSYKIRAGSPMNQELTIYADSEQKLFDLHAKILAINASWNKGTFTSVPDDMRQSLAAGKKVVRKIDAKWTHHVELSDGKMPEDDKRAVLKYLDGMGGDVEMREGTRNALTRPGMYIYGLWFRTCDPSILDFVQLLSPGIVKKVIELDHRP